MPTGPSRSMKNWREGYKKYTNTDTVGHIIVWIQHTYTSSQLDTPVHDWLLTICSSFNPSPARRLMRGNFHTNRSINVQHKLWERQKRNKDALLQRTPGVFSVMCLLRCGRRQRGWAGQFPSDPIWYRQLHFYLVPHGVSWSSQRADEGICCKCVCGPCEIINGVT